MQVCVSVCVFVCKHLRPGREKYLSQAAQTGLWLLGHAIRVSVTGVASECTDPSLSGEPRGDSSPKGDSGNSLQLCLPCLSPAAQLFQGSQNRGIKERGHCPGLLGAESPWGSQEAESGVRNKDLGPVRWR